MIRISCIPSYYYQHLHICLNQTNRNTRTTVTKPSESGRSSRAGHTLPFLYVLFAAIFCSKPAFPWRFYCNNFRVISSTFIHTKCFCTKLVACTMVVFCFVRLSDKYPEYMKICTIPLVLAGIQSLFTPLGRPLCLHGQAALYLVNFSASKRRPSIQHRLDSHLRRAYTYV